MSLCCATQVPLFLRLSVRPFGNIFKALDALQCAHKPQLSDCHL